MLARIADNAVVEIRPLSLLDIPEHKRSQWLAVEGEAPSYDSRTHTRTGPTYQIEADRVLSVWHVTARDLATVKSEYAARVDDAAEAERLKYVTPGAGMAMTYQEKKDQAVAVLSLGEVAANALPNDGVEDFPLLAASVPAEAATLYAAAQLIIARYEAWSAIGGAIEAKRLAGKKAINDAQDVSAVKAAYDAIVWGS